MMVVSLAFYISSQANNINQKEGFFINLFELSYQNAMVQVEQALNTTLSLNNASINTFDDYTASANKITSLNNSYVNHNETFSKQIGFSNCFPNPTNIATAGTATASSEAFGGYAAAGIDSDVTDTNIHHSAIEANPFWQVDLGNECNIGEIVFWNRVGQTARADGLIIEILDAGGIVQFSTTLATAPIKASIEVPGIKGQIVRLRLEGNDRILNFYEVEVFGGDVPKVFALQASCTNGVPNNDAYLVMSDITYGDAFHYSIGNTFDNNGGDNTYANAQTIVGTSAETAKILPNPTIPTVYTIRLYNESDACFEDIQITLNPQDCVVGCNCEEYIYLNETSNSGAVHKFQASSNGTLTEIPGANGIPWYASNNEPSEDHMPSPHGLGTDLNGNLYIGQTFLGNIRKLDCLGNIQPTSTFDIADGGFNVTTIDNELYLNSAVNPGIYAYDICDQTPLGHVLMEDNNGNSATSDDWGFYIDGQGTFYSTTGFTACSDNQLYIFTPSAMDFTNNTVYNPAMESNGVDPIIGSFGVMPTGDIRGVTTDINGNIYIVRQDECGGSCSRIYKYAPVTYELLAISDQDCDGSNGNGWNQAIGIVYNEDCNCLYVSTESQTDDCVYRFNLDLTNTGISGTAIGPVPTGGQAKGIAKTKECCPINNVSTIDTTLCDVSINDRVFLQDLINCDGTICEGVWQEGMSNSGLDYNSCNYSVTIDSLNACGSFTLESDGTGNNARCGAFKITVNITVNKVTAAIVEADQSICSGGDPSPFTLVTAASGGTLTHQWQVSTTDCTSGFSDIPGATSSIYDAPAGLATTSYYRVITSSINTGCSTGICADTSNCLTVTVIPLPTAMASTTGATCIGSNANADGTITLTGFDIGERFDFNIGNTYTGSATFSTGSTEIPINGIIANSLVNPTGTQEYTIRIFNTNGCTLDRVVTLTENNCSCPAPICLPVQTTINN